MAELTARRDSLLDYLPGNWQQAINTNPLLNALGRAMNRKTPDLGEAAMREYGTPEQQEKADQDWLLQKMRGPKLNPLAAEMLDKGGMLANFLGPGVKLPAAAPKPTGIRAYHGSPHDFDRFDMSKIGTGEGAQAYGRGLYFAENEGVAKAYRDGLSQNTILVGGKTIPTAGALNGPSAAYQRQYGNMTMAEQMLADHNGNFDRSIRDLVALAEIKKKNPTDRWITNSVAEYEAAAEQLRRMRTGEWAHPGQGRMYEVNIKADPDQFLDWDKPLSQQPEGVRKAIGYDLAPEVEAEAVRLARQLEDTYARIGASKTRRPVDPIMFRQTDDMEKRLAEIDPKGLATTRLNLLTQEPGAVERLRDAGIPGIKYLDQGSRTAGQGSRNFVVFDDKLIEILRKYGLLPPVAAGTAAALNEQEPQQ